MTQTVHGIATAYKTEHEGTSEFESNVDNHTDAILRAATESFASPRRRSPQEISAFAQLVRPMLPKASRNTLRWVSAALSSCDFAPSETCRTLANQSISIAAPILATAAKLSIDDQIAIAQSKSEEHRVVLAQRRGISEAVIDAILAYGEAEPTRHLLRNKPEAMSVVQSQNALSIIANNMNANLEIEQALNTQSTATIANDITNTHALELSQLRNEISNRSVAMESARAEISRQRAPTNQIHNSSSQGTFSAQTFQANKSSQNTSLGNNTLQATGQLAPHITGQATNTHVLNQLLEALESYNQNTLQRVLEQVLELAPLKVNALLADRSLEGLCVALRAIKCDPTLAHRILMVAHMIARRDMRLINRLQKAYPKLDIKDCKQVLQTWQNTYPKNGNLVENSHKTQRRVKI